MSHWKKVGGGGEQQWRETSKQKYPTWNLQYILHLLVGTGYWKPDKFKKSLDIAITSRLILQFNSLHKIHSLMKAMLDGENFLHDFSPVQLVHTPCPRISPPYIPWVFLDPIKLLVFSSNSYDAILAIAIGPLVITLVVCGLLDVKLFSLHLMKYIHERRKVTWWDSKKVRMLQWTSLSFIHTTQISQISSLSLFSSQRVSECSLEILCNW